MNTFNPDPYLKKWQCAHAWWEDAEFHVSLCYINRLHRSGYWGEGLVARAEAWAKKCEDDMDRAAKALVKAHAEHLKLDEEQRIMDELEDQLVENVQYFWKKTREYGLAGHDDWRDVWDPFTQSWFCTGCNCNQWNRIELMHAVRRLRAWRKGVYEAY